MLAEMFEVAVQTYGAFTASNYMRRNALRVTILICNVMLSPLALATRYDEVAVALDICFDVAYTFIGLTTFLQYFYENEGDKNIEVTEADDWTLVIIVVSMVSNSKANAVLHQCSLVIIVRRIFIRSFLFYCLLLNHSFSNKPKTRYTNCFSTYSLSLFTIFTNYICSMRSSIFDF